MVNVGFTGPDAREKSRSRPFWKEGVVERNRSLDNRGRVFDLHILTVAKERVCPAIQQRCPLIQSRR
jgi:hypothetical protein